MAKWNRRLAEAFYHWKGAVRAPMGGGWISLSTETNAKQVYWLHRKLLRNEFEPQVITALLENLRPGQVCCEIGTWIGPYSILLSRQVGAAGTLYLFEPDPVARRACAENLHLNGCDNAFLFPLAASDHNGEERLYNDSFGNSVSSLIPRFSAESRNEPSLKVQSCTLDAFFAMAGCFPDFVKIDVEGAEDKVIAGGLAVLSRRGVKILMEVHVKLLQQRGIRAETIIDRFRSMNKRVWLLGNETQEVSSLRDGAFTADARFHILATD